MDATLNRPAIYFAEHGVPISPMLEDIISRRPELLDGRPEAREILMRADGTRYRSGDLFVRPKLAEAPK